jgi:hypothetical protein
MSDEQFRAVLDGTWRPWRDRAPELPTSVPGPARYFPEKAIRALIAIEVIGQLRAAEPAQ